MKYSEEIGSFLERQKKSLLLTDGADESTHFLTAREASGHDFVAFDRKRQRQIGMKEMLYENTIAWLMDAGRGILKNEWMDLVTEEALSEDTTTSKIQTFTTSLLPAVRAIFTNLVAMDLVSLQPLGGPSGFIYWMDHKYVSDHDADGIKAGDKVADHQDAKTYTDSKEKDTDIRELEASLTSKLIYTEIKKVATKWTMEAEQDFSSQWKMNLEAELMPELSNQIIREVNRKIISALLAGAKNNVDWDMTVPDDDKSSADKIAFYQTLWHSIQWANAQIIGEKYQPATWMMMNHNTYFYLERLNNFKADPNVGEVGATYTRFVGTLSGLYKVYVDPWFQDNTILMGIRGGSWRDSVAYYAPYIPLFLSDKHIYNNDFTQFVRGAATRYAYGVIPESKDQSPIKNGGLATITITGS